MEYTKDTTYQKYSSLNEIGFICKYIFDNYHYQPKEAEQYKPELFQILEEKNYSDRKVIAAVIDDFFFEDNKKKRYLKMGLFS